MSKAHATRTLRTLNATVESDATLDRATQKRLNRALFAHNLPTLGKATTLAAYTRTLTGAQMVALGSVVVA